MNAIVDGHSLAMDGPLRRCALTLHAIPKQDRAWVLSRLTGPRRCELEQLIEELDTLGIAPDPRLARAAVGARTAPEISLEAAAAQVPLADQAALMARALHGEPPRLVAHVLLSRGVALSQAVLALMDAPRRLTVQDQLDALQAGDMPFAPAPKLTALLAQELERRIAPLRKSGRAPTPAATRGWRSGWRRIGKLLS